MMAENKKATAAIECAEPSLTRLDAAQQCGQLVHAIRKGPNRAELRTLKRPSRFRCASAAVMSCRN
jgi:hypothetical protein